MKKYPISYMTLLIIISTDNPDQFFANPERYLIYGNLTAISDLFVLLEGYKTWREENCGK